MLADDSERRPTLRARSEMSAGDPPRWCRACGAIAAEASQAPAKPDDPGDPGHRRKAHPPACAVCRTPLDRPDPGPARVGRVVLVGNRLLARHAVVIDERRNSLLILDRGDTPVPVSADRIARLPVLPVTPDDVTSAAGRLWAARAARAAGAFKARWTDAAADAAALRAATASLGTRRAAAVDLAALGLPPRPELGLSRSEITWYRARAAAYGPVPGDPDTLLRLLAELPAAGYPDRVTLLMQRLAELCADATLAARAAALVEPAAWTSPDARALRAALAATPPPDAVDLLGEYTATVAGDGTPVADAIAAGRPLPGGGGPHGPALTAFDAYQAALVRCRTDPGGADEETLRAAGFVAEQARRAYLAGDGARLAELPAGHEAVRHYGALLAYRAGRPSGGRPDLDALRRRTRETIRITDALARATGGPRAAAAEIAADPSTWPLLWGSAVDGRISVDDDRRSEHPEFGHWLDLCSAYGSLGDGRWADAAAAADRVAAVSGLAPLTAEALNLAAYAWWHLDRPDEALHRLDEALTTHPAEGQAVNAALVAGAGRALSYLARVMGLTASPGVRQGALTRAVSLWMSGDTGAGYPPALGAMVRAELAATQEDDEYHRTLLTLSFRNDRAWLATADVTARGPLQERTTRYVQRRAAFETRPSKVALRAVTVALVGVWRLHPRPEWAAAELAWLTEVLDQALGAPYDAATNPVPAVDTLLGTEVLELASHLVLSMRAGAYLAREAERRGQALSAETERRLVLTPIQTFRRRRDELDEPDRKAVSAALAGCLETATGAIVNVTVRRNRHLMRRWRQLQAEPVQDYADGRRVVAQRIDVLDRLDGHVRRCRAYLKAMDGLPVNERFRKQVREAVDGWSGVSSQRRRSLA